MPRWLNGVLAIVLLIVLCIPILIIVLLTKCTSSGPALHWSSRVGRNNTLFQMLKFCTMRTDTPTVATHLLTDPDRYITPLGKFLRKTSLDELPQIWSILLLEGKPSGPPLLIFPKPESKSQPDITMI